MVGYSLVGLIKKVAHHKVTKNTKNSSNLEKFYMDISISISLRTLHLCGGKDASAVSIPPALQPGM
jgi:hypothetical protein